MSTTPQHAALFRNDKGGLEVRHYPTAADAMAVAIERELPAPDEIDRIMGWKGRREIRHTEFARRLGISPRIVREQYKRGGLPGAKEHSAYILMVPMHLLRLATCYGLRQVERMAHRGMIPTPERT